MAALLSHLGAVLLFIIVLAVLVLVHELGHFLAARAFGIEVEEFGFGFPPRIGGIKKGKTLYSLNWIPLGGFVRIKGEDDPSARGRESFGERPAYVRVIVIAAGVFMNLVLASILFAAALGFGIPQVVEDIPAGAQMHDVRIQVVDVLKGLPAEQAGLRAGDTILSLDGKPYDKIEDIQAYVNAHGSTAIDLKVRRGGDTLDEQLTPKPDPESGRLVMGLELAKTAIVSYSAPVALWKGIYSTGFYAKEIVLSVYDLLKNLVTGQKAAVEFSGPVGIAVLTGRAVRLGLVYLLQFAGLLSVNLAVINILPIPALDGGRLLFIIIERFRGRGVRPQVEAAIHRIAFLLLLLLVLLVTISDLNRYGAQILNLLKSLVGPA